MRRSVSSSSMVAPREIRSRSVLRACSTVMASSQGYRLSAYPNVAVPAAHRGDTHRSRRQKPRKECNLRAERPRLSDREPPVALDLDPVHLDRAALAEIADEVPVHCRLVHPAGLGIARPHRHVNGAADLLVEQDLLGAGA